MLSQDDKNPREPHAASDGIELSVHTDRPVAAMIRRAIERYLDAEESTFRTKKR